MRPGRCGLAGIILEGKVRLIRLPAKFMLRNKPGLERFLRYQCVDLKEQLERIRCRMPKHLRDKLHELQNTNKQHPALQSYAGLRDYVRPYDLAFQIERRNSTTRKPTDRGFRSYKPRDNL